MTLLGMHNDLFGKINYVLFFKVGERTNKPFKICVWFVTTRFCGMEAMTQGQS